MNPEALLLDFTEDILLLLDGASLHIRAANRAAASRLGYRQDELTDKHITDIECALSDVFFWEEVGRGGRPDIEDA